MTTKTWRIQRVSEKTHEKIILCNWDVVRLSSVGNTGLSLLRDFFEGEVIAATDFEVSRYIRIHMGIHFIHVQLGIVLGVTFGIFDQFLHVAVDRLGWTEKTMITSVERKGQSNTRHTLNSSSVANLAWISFSRNEVIGSRLLRTSWISSRVR